MNDEFAAEDLIFSEDAIEQAYQLALRASEEAGMLPSPPELPPDPANESELAAGLNSEQTSGDSNSTTSHKHSERDDVKRGPRFQPEQIVEALLFVGGEKLTAKKMAGFIGHHCPDTRIREYIESINVRYRQQNRPYEIVLGEEGYQMTLKPEFQKQKHLLYGLGPREVKLSQDALEVLSLIAFEQPLTKEDLAQLDRSNLMSCLRQLIRRELVQSAKTTRE